MNIIGEIEKEKEIEIIEYECRKVIHFEDPEDIGDCYALEIEENKLLFWWGSFYPEESILPFSKIEFFANPDVEYVLGRSFTTKGKQLQVVKIPSEITADLWKDFPEHNEIINSNVDTYLKEIEQKYQ